jgi:hypothetical protein
MIATSQHRTCRGVLLALAVLLFVQPAFAYTDPGSGALLFQLLTSALVGATFCFRRVIFWFRRKRDK